MRIPAMFIEIELDESALEEVQELQVEQAEYFKTRALRIIEDGSQYSSDFEEIEKSDYVSTDGEGTTNQEEYNVSNIKVLRGITLRPDLNKASEHRPKVVAHAIEGELGVINEQP